MTTAAPPDELLATCWSSAGDAASDRTDLRSPLTLRERVRSRLQRPASEASASSPTTSPRPKRHTASRGIRDLLADNGITHLELEGIPYWWDDGAHRRESDRVRQALLEAAETLGARHLKVTPDAENTPWDRGLWAARFAELAAQAHDVGARLGIEFFPWANVASLQQRPAARQPRLVTRAGGVVIDTWHIARAGTHTPCGPGDRAAPTASSASSSTTRTKRWWGSLFEDTVHRRRYCGEGDFDLDGHDHGPPQGRAGPGRGASRSSPTSTGRCQLVRHFAAPPPAPAARSRPRGRRHRGGAGQTVRVARRSPRAGQFRSRIHGTVRRPPKKNPWTETAHSWTAETVLPAGMKTSWLALLILPAGACPSSCHHGWHQPRTAKASCQFLEPARLT